MQVPEAQVAVRVRIWPVNVVMVMAGLPLTFTPAGTVSVLLNVFFPERLLTAGNPSSVAAPVSTRLVIVKDARTLKFLVT